MTLPMMLFCSETRNWLIMHTWLEYKTPFRKTLQQVTFPTVQRLQKTAALVMCVGNGSLKVNYQNHLRLYYYYYYCY